VSDETANKQGVLLLGHGTRSLAGKRQFLDLCQHFSSLLSSTPVEPAFLELQHPTIADGLGQLLDRGVRRLRVVPLLLFAAGHVKEDIPAAIRAGVRSLGFVAVTSIELTQADPFGCHPALVELSRRRFEQAIAGKAQISGNDCCLIFVGRGSNDANATAEMHEFARMRQQSHDGLQIRVAFLAMAQPLLASELQKVAACSFRRVIVQPHLLFHGELVAAVEEQVGAIKSRGNGQEWIVTSSLADPGGEIGCGTELLTNVMWERYQQGAIHVVVTDTRS